jgi:ribosomal protein S18 acetylase RimI-like enzyme
MKPVLANEIPMGINRRQFRSTRQAHEHEIEHLADIWYEGWQHAHATILPAELARLRTWESFRERLQADLHAVRVVGPVGSPVGFCMIREEELYQLYVSPAGRGTGVAALLEADAVAAIADHGARVAWLACAIGNDRAARFYEKVGWRRVGTMVSQLETQNGLFSLQVWRYEKRLKA